MTQTEENKKKSYRDQILYLLLRKYEDSKTFFTGEYSKQRPQFAMKESPLKNAYYDEMDYRARELIHEVIDELCDKALIEVSWPKFLKGKEIEKVFLNFDSVGTAYAILGLTPKADKINQLRNELGTLSIHPWEWVRMWWQESDSSLRDRKTRGLDIDDIEGYRSLVTVFTALPSLEEAIPKRVLSQRLFADTKRLENVVERRLLSVTKRYCGQEFENDDEYLDFLGIVEHPKLILLSGPFRFISMGIVTDVSGLPGGVGLSNITVKDLEIKDIGADRILLIENLTSYYQLANAQLSYELTTGNKPKSLFVYTGGFPNRGNQLLLKKVAGFINTVPTTLPVYHWGDMDLGGIQIFEYIKTNFFHHMTPYRMNVQTYRDYFKYGRPFGADYANKLNRMLAKESLQHWEPLIREMLDRGKVIEQECMDTMLKIDYEIE